MPGWHAETQQLQRDGTLQNVGIIQEQHPSRARLFMQWQQMDWPVMVDSLNLLGLNVVPVTYLVDEAGIIRYRGNAENLAAFLADDPPTPRPEPITATVPAATADAGPVASADHHFLWGGPDHIDDAIDGYRRALDATQDGQDVGLGAGAIHFRLGVSHRRRAETVHRQDGDFGRAVEHWGRALDADPNQYIWRRRIQQYGPRLEKPYSFYDWVETARREVKARGEEPAALDVEPRGAELASPSRTFATAGPSEPPEQAHRIHRDEKGLILLEKTLVPAQVTAGSSARVHLLFRPNAAIKGHWNNEAEDMEVWLETPDGWQIDRRRLTVANPDHLVSDEERRLELEVRSPEGAKASELNGFALYYICEDVRGTCLYRRHDFTVPLPVATAGP